MSTRRGCTPSPRVTAAAIDKRSPGPGVQVEPDTRFLHHLVHDALQQFRVDYDAHAHPTVLDEIVVVLQFLGELGVIRT